MSTSNEPFVRPVRVPEHLTLGAANPPLAPAGDSGAWELTFTLGEDIPPAADLHLLCHGGRNVKGTFAPLQTTDPEADGYLAVTTGDGAPISTDPERSAGGDIALCVPDGGLAGGGAIHVHLRATAPTVSLSNKMFLLFVPDIGDPGVPKSNAQAARRIVGACLIHVTGNRPARLRAYLPSQAASGAELSILVRPEDKYGNLANEPPGKLLVEVQGQEMAASQAPVAGTTCCRLDGIVLTEPGVYRLVVSDPASGLQATTNPIRTGPAAGRGADVLWGYIHGHTELSDGAGTTDNYFTCMRDGCGLDFGALGDHDHLFETTDDMWRQARDATIAYHEPGKFVTLSGYEWAKWRQNGDGDRNVYYLEDGRPMYRSDDGHCASPPELFAALANETAMVIPHHPAEIGNHCDYKDHDPEKQRLVEIYSNWGSSERSVNDGNPYPVRHTRRTGDMADDAGEVPSGFVQRALALGCRIGFTAGGDDHLGHPGVQRAERTAPWQYNTGIFSVQAGETTREAIWQALWQRRCVGTTGARMIVDFEVASAPMGSELSLAERPELRSRRDVRVTVHGTAPIHRIEIVRGNREVHVHPGAGEDATLAWTDEEEFDAIAMPPADHCPTPFCFYYLRVTQTDGEMAWASPVWILS